MGYSRPHARRAERAEALDRMIDSMSRADWEDEGARPPRTMELHYVECPACGARIRMRRGSQAGFRCECGFRARADWEDEERETERLRGEEPFGRRHRDE